MDPKQKLAQFEQRNSQPGLLQRYVRGRVRAIWLRLLVAAAGAIVLALYLDPKLGLAVGTVAISLELIEQSILLRVGKTAGQAHNLGQNSALLTIGAFLQTLGNTAAILIAGFQSDGFHLLAIVFCIGALINAQLSAQYHRPSYWVRVALLAPAGFSFSVADILFGRWTSDVIVEVVAIGVLLVMQWLMFANLAKRSASHLHTDHQLLQAAVHNADTLEALRGSQEALAQQSKEAQRLADVARNAQDGLATLDANGRLFWTNAYFQELTGYPLDAMIGDRQIQMLASCPENIAAQKQLDDSRKNPKAVRVKVLIDHADGRQIWVSINRSPVFNADGVLLYFISSWRDISDAEEQRDRLARALEDAKAADIEKAAFLQRMSHELRTPLNGIVGGAEVLQELQLNTTQSQALDLVRSSTNRLTRLVEDILLFSEPSGQRDMSDAIDLAQVCNDLVTRHQPLAKAKGLQLCPDMNHEALPYHCNDDALRKILSALLDNAIRFTPAGSVTLGLRVTKQSAEDQVLIWVEDTGPGVPIDLRDKIFEQFTQADGLSSRAADGAGLGLAIARKLAEQMGGTLELSADPKKQSRFELSLTLKRADPVAPDPAAAPRDFLQDADLVLLVAEDNKTNRLLISKMFRDTKCQLEFAVDGIEAVEKFQELLPSLVLMDLSMPHKDGLEATRDIRTIETKKGLQPCQIVALTANAYDSDKQSCFSAGMDAFLAKPVRKAKLMGTINSALARAV